MSSDHRHSTRESTLEAASAFLEDMRHIRNLLRESVQDQGEVRRLSVTLRRLLVNGELSHIAAPRLDQKLFILAQDLKGVQRLVDKHRPQLFMATDTPLFSAYLFGTAQPNIGLRRDNSWMQGGVPEVEDVELSIDTFLKQRVVYLAQTWITRREIIQHVAIHRSAAHSKPITDAKEILISRLRDTVRVRPDEGGVKLELEEYADLEVLRQPISFKSHKGTMTGLIAQILSVANSLAKSPDIIKLESIIEAELS